MTAGYTEGELAECAPRIRYANAATLGPESMCRYGTRIGVSRGLRIFRGSSQMPKRDPWLTISCGP